MEVFPIRCYSGQYSRLPCDRITEQLDTVLQLMNGYRPSPIFPGPASGISLRRFRNVVHLKITRCSVLEVFITSPRNLRVK